MRKAFTLVEVIATLGLSSLVMMGLLAVLQTLQPASSQLGPKQEMDAAVRRALSQIRRDCAQAQAIQQDSQGLMLTGYCGFDSTDEFPGQTPVVVRYRALVLGDRHWLVRQQEAVGTKGMSQELVLGDLEDFQITRSDQSQARTTAFVSSNASPLWDVAIKLVGQPALHEILEGR